MMNLRLSSHWQVHRILGEIFVYGPDLFGDVGEGLAKKLESLLFDLGERFFRLHSTLSSIFVIFVGCGESPFGNRDTFHGPHVGCHVIQFGVQSLDFAL